ncbi:MAG: DUF2953 domain-containing protein [Clostridia bacterium]|nr:DUF2953 domain-containing protein [Clostridia bacterium]
MTAVYIVAVILIVLLLLLILPVTGDIEFDGEFKLILRVLGIKVYSSDKDKKKSKSKEPPTKEQPPQKKSRFDELKEKYGFTGAIKYGAKLINLTVKRIAWFIKRLKFRKFTLLITVASDNAAKTGIEYGIVCTAVYPIITYLETNADFKAKKIDINADFDVTNPDIKFSVSIKTGIIMAVFTIVSALRQYKHLVKESEDK